MKSGKAVGPDDIPVEVWKCLGEAAVEFLTSLFNRVLESERMPEEWRRSVLVPIFKNKGDVQSCSNYRGIKLMSHTMKLWERVVEARLRKVVEICEQQYGFMPRKNTTDAIFALRILMEKYRDGQRELHCVFVDLEKAYDRVPREELWYCRRKSGVAEKYVRVVQDMYERSRTVVRCAVGQTEEFKVEVGLHQGSALSPFLFAIVMDQLSEEVRQESPWTMMFADDIVICSESREQVEENLERWRFALERRGMKVSGSKTEYMCVNEREGSGTVRLQGEEVKKVQEFKYLGSTVQSNGECGKEVKKRVQAGWNGWRKVSGVLCDRKISARIKGKVYRTVVRAAMLYGLETVSLRKRQESELEVAELKMLRFSLGVTRLDRIRNEYIRGTAHVGRLGDKVRETRLRWFGHVQRRDNHCNGPLTAQLPPTSFQSSSVSSESHAGFYARLNNREGGGGWKPDHADPLRWLQVDLRERMEVVAMVTQGAFGSSDWVTRYTLLYSDTGRDWKQYRHEDYAGVFPGNTDADGVTHHKLPHSIRTRFLRFLPQDWSSEGWIGLRVEVYGCSYKSDVADFDGRSALMYRFSQKSMSTVKDVISLQFKSRRSDGVLVHGEGQRGDYITLELHRGRLALHINLGNSSLLLSHSSSVNPPGARFLCHELSM
ncbi:hypothetical protein QTP86_011749 [Hemibagrus guttatus]|nr:hypothetical protein QTP86_011749 [Hemibagrus guttatus]